MSSSAGEVRIAIPHMRIELGSKKKNFERIRRVAQLAKEMGAHILVLPSMFNVGPIDNPLFRTRISRKKFIESRAEHTVSILREISTSFGITIVGGPIYERVGSKTYRTVLVVEPLKGLVYRARKIVTEEGSSPISEAVIELGLTFGILAEEDVVLPELSLYMILRGIDAIIAFLSLGPEGLKQRGALVARAMECRCTALAIGGIVCRGGEDLYEVPTAIINEEGSVCEEVKGMNEKIMGVNLRRSFRKLVDERRIKLIKSLRKLLMRR